MYDTNWSDEYLKSGGYKPSGSTEHDHLCRCPGCEGNDPPEDQQVMRDAYQDEQGMQALEEAMWKKWKEENAIEPVLPEQVAEKDCPLCPEWAEEKFKIGYDDFGGICQIDGVACCDTCYRVYHLTQPYEESL